MTDLDSNIVDVPNPGGHDPDYCYFDTIKKLLNVRKLFEKFLELCMRHTCYQQCARAPQRAIEDAMQWVAVEEWMRLDEARREAKKGNKSNTSNDNSHNNNKINKRSKTTTYPNQ
ncbi:hypothetical protein CR513_40860, partial [Mucuna pruriens]